MFILKKKDMLLPLDRKVQVTIQRKYSPAAPPIFVMKMWMKMCFVDLIINNTYQTIIQVVCFLKSTC